MLRSKAGEPVQLAVRRRLAWPLVLASVAVAAVACRLVPLLRGGGLLGLGNYDDGVYYGAAVALVHGRLPYRDFLLLHPPGIVVALSPFAAFGRLTSEHLGLAAARGAWILLGAASAVLVCLVLRGISTQAALLGGLSYAVFYPAVYVESLTQLQGLGNLCLIGAMALLVGGPRTRPLDNRAVLLAGALLGVAATAKIWGVVPILLVAGWQLITGGVRKCLLLGSGALAAIVLICLPFFVAAPSAMWRDVVTAQLNRSRTRLPLAARLNDIVGLRLFHVPDTATVWLVLALIGLVLAVWLALGCTQGRLAVVLLAGSVVVMLASPTWFQHYAALAAVPLAVVLGAAGGRIVAMAGRKTARFAVVVTMALVVAMAAYAAPVLTRASIGRSYPGRTLGAVVRSMPGCVTADNLVALVAMDVLGRDLTEGCSFVGDLGGYSYVLPYSGDRPPSREQHEQWQQNALGYLRSGDVAILVTYSEGNGLSRATAATINSWPVITTVGSYRLLSPQP